MTSANRSTWKSSGNITGGEITEKTTEIDLSNDATTIENGTVELLIYLSKEI